MGAPPFGWLYGSGQGFHWSDGINCPGSVFEGVANCLWGDVSRESFDSQGELAERYLEGCECATIKLKRGDEHNSQDVAQDSQSQGKSEPLG